MRGSTHGIEYRAVHYARTEAGGAFVLNLRGLVKRYGSRTDLDGLSPKVAKGQVFGLVRLNGSGKTTMRTILGIVAPDEGEIPWRGRSADAGMRRRFGYMPEERGSCTARLPRLRAKEAKDAAARWVERCGVAQTRERPKASP